MRAAKDWSWSSYRATAGLSPTPPWLTTHAILGAFAQRPRTARTRYRAFVAEGTGQPTVWAQLKNQMYLGADDFVEKTQRRIGRNKDLSEIPRAHKRPVAKPLAYYEGTYRNRDAAIWHAYASGGYSMSDIGTYFGLHYSRISRIITHERKATRKT